MAAKLRFQRSFYEHSPISSKFYECDGPKFEGKLTLDVDGCSIGEIQLLLDLIREVRKEFDSRPLLIDSREIVITLNTKTREMSDD